MPKQHYRPETFRTRESIGYLLKRSQRLMQENVEGLFADQGFTLQQWAVMMHIRDGMALTVADLCRELHHDSGAMTRLIDQLEQRELIERRRNSQDRRVIELSLTDKGSEVIVRLIGIVSDALNVALDGFTRDEVKLLQAMLHKLICRLEHLVPGASPVMSGELTERK